MAIAADLASRQATIFQLARLMQILETAQSDLEPDATSEPST
ncbi:hypothetical protein HanPI659440_Chr12g0475711 [Helianthus annuus]|nr:hypothetical protein HanPI659440_Chr12g0475711 [Helianthus annuus]